MKTSENSLPVAENSLRRLDGIQAARGFAALLVVLTHTQNLFETYHSRFGLALPKFNHHFFAIIGNSGVDIFFVISGFILTHMTWTQFGEGGGFQESKTFMKKRLIRVGPLYWIFTTVMVIVMIFFPSLIISGKSTSLMHTVSSYLFIPWKLGADQTPLLTPGWSLNYEMLFYLFLAMVLPLKRSSGLFVAASGLFILMGFARLLEFSNLSTYGVWFFGNTMILEFVLGILVAVMFRNSYVAKFKGTSFILGFVLLTVVAIRVGLPGPSIRGVFWGLPAALIVLDTLTWKKVPRIFILLGNISYSLYLTHFFVGVGLGRLWLKLGLNWPVEILALLEMTIPIVVAFIVYKFIENPLHLRMLKKVT